ncbi:MAG: hypothetical protein J0H17_21940 [Rhizobiales bacterium]|nr:hypothetical protein [Hyphomicrobiales bacterium]
MILIYTGASWVDWSTLLSFQNLPMLGVNTTADATNKLAAKTNAVLFDALRAANGGNGDIQIKLSKEAAGDTASFLFQTNYSGRAEIGLTGDDDLHFKVSPDGSSWNEAILVNRSTGLVTLALVDINGGAIDGANIGAATAGTGRFSTLTATGAVTLSPASANVAISPTGTGTVTISPAGALTINPAAASSINNCSIGATTPSSGQFTTLSATGAATLSPANANVTLSPTGTGTVTINPTTAGNINNVAIGQTTAAAIRGTTINATSAFQVAATQVVGTRKTGWAAASGTATRTTFATSTVTLSVLAEHVKALIDDLISHGLIGT